MAEIKWDLACVCVWCVYCDEFNNGSLLVWAMNYLLSFCLGKARIELYTAKLPTRWHRLPAVAANSKCLEKTYLMVVSQSSNIC